jgi:hypothetical protein
MTSAIPFREDAVTDEHQNSEVVATLKWHFEAKRLALRNALRLRCPLTAGQANELRLNYSEYFAHLISATELLLEKEYLHHEDFKQALEKRFVFDGYPDGADNYSFVREFRNSVIHRGHDIASSAHVEKNFLKVIAPPSVTNRSGTKTYQGLGFYLLDVISKCEAVVGPTIAQHLEGSGLLTLMVDQDKSVEEARKFIAASDAMPSWAKIAAIESIAQVDFAEAQQLQVAALLKILLKNALDAEFGQQGADVGGCAFDGAAI